MTIDRKIFVDQNVSISTGESAGEKLSEVNDAKYFKDKRGVVQVPKERWRIAQAYERHTWMVANSAAADDRNYIHLDGFDSYATLEGLPPVGRAIELGCGPFTNMRLIGRHCRIGAVTLLDPLIQHYLEHPNCTYRNKSVAIGGGRQASYGSRFMHLFRRKGSIPVEAFVPSSIEEAPDLGKFDLVVMINVIEHCYDIELMFKKILDMTNKGGIFVFHDKLFSAENVRQNITNRYDAGHPLRADRAEILGFLDGQFDQLYRRFSRVTDGFEDIDLTEEGVYFIGRRR